ncbi:endonuclease/exonuclease/phosphatase family protein [Nonomuraea sp. NPDC055795]
MLSLLTVNIGAAAQARAERLLDWLAGRDEDVFLLTETSAGAGTAHLLQRYARAGYAVVKTDDIGDRGAALISRIPVVDDLVALSKVSIPGRVAAAVLGTSPQLTVAAVYVPSRDASVEKTERKRVFIDSLLHGLEGLPQHQREQLLLGGDYNVIARTHQPPHRGFLPFEYGLLDGLAEHGLLDAHDHHAPGPHPHSWIGRTGDGYRYDYIHLATALADRITACAYLHETRELALTDHAAVTLTLDLQATRLPVIDPRDSHEIALF